MRTAAAVVTACALAMLAAGGCASSSGPSPTPAPLASRTPDVAATSDALLRALDAVESALRRAQRGDKASDALSAAADRLDRALDATRPRFSAEPPAASSFGGWTEGRPAGAATRARIDDLRAAANALRDDLDRLVDALLHGADATGLVDGALRRVDDLRRRVADAMRALG